MKQRKSNKYTVLKVSPQFHSRIKAEAAYKGCSVFDYSQALADSGEQLDKVFAKNNNAMKRGFKFEL